jgi:hypothetical protein
LVNGGKPFILGTKRITKAIVTIAIICAAFLMISTVSAAQEIENSDFNKYFEKTVKINNTNPQWTENKEFIKKPELVTVKAMPSTGSKYKYKYTWYVSTFESKCCYCSGTLKINPKRVYERELTCGKCGADYCAVSGKEKETWSKKYLNKVGKSVLYTDYVKTKNKKANN